MGYNQRQKTTSIVLALPLAGAGMTIVNTLLAVLCRTLLAGVFWLSIRLSHSLTVQGTICDRGAPRIYLGMMHKRDIDPFLLVPIVLFHHGRKALARDMRFALRGDGFSRGFLARIVHHPAWLAWLLRPLAVGPALRWLGAYPTDGLLRPAEEWIREALQIAGDVPAAAILSPAFIQDVTQAAYSSSRQVHDLPLSQLLRWPYHAVLQRFYGPEMLLRSKRRRIERRLVERIHHQIDKMVTLPLAGGLSLWFARGPALSRWTPQSTPLWLPSPCASCSLRSMRPAGWDHL
jgi:hypothetical protein